MRKLRGRRLGAVSAAVAIALAVTGGAVALGGGIPSPDGMITTCFSKAKGTWRPIDTSTTSCRADEQTLSWNQDGSPGQPGSPGDDGLPGADGVSVTSTPLGQGDTHCPNGGSAFSSASGPTYACNGADGQAGSGGGLPLGSEVRTAQSDFFSNGAPHVLGSITVSSRSIITFTGGLSVIPDQDGLGNNQPVTIRCALQSAANNTGIGVAVHAGMSQAGSLPITVQGIAEAGDWNILCLRVSQAGGFIAFAGNLTAVQVGF